MPQPKRERPPRKATQPAIPVNEIVMPRARHERPPRNQVLSVKVSEADAEAIREAAAREGVTVSEYMRSATIVQMAIEGNKYALGCLKSGAVRVAVEVWEKVRTLFAGGLART